MSDQVINVHGEDVVVREDTAKAYRGVHWAILSIGAFVIITAIMFVYFSFVAATDADTVSPAATQQK